MATTRTFHNFVSLLRACAKEKDLHKGITVHADIVKRGLLGKSTYLNSNLVNMYGRCGALSRAQSVFDELLERDVVSWTALITGYTLNGYGEEALGCFDYMQHEGSFPDAVTFLCALKACGSTGAVRIGAKLHSEITEQGWLEKHFMLGTALLDMYAKCGALAKAQEVFDKLPVCDAVCWSALISGYAQHGYAREALACFQRMQLCRLTPTVGTLPSILKACGSIGALDQGTNLHAEFVKEETLEENILVANALVDMYAKCGAVAKAQEVFDKIPARDVVSWNTLVAGYVQHGYMKEALECFQRMQCEGFSPDTTTFHCILQVYGKLGAIDASRELHAVVVRAGLFGKEVTLGNGLVEMYANFRLLGKAQEVFDELPVRDTVSWNILIAGYDEQGMSGKSLSCFDNMQLEGSFPNRITYLGVLKACGSTGAVEKGKEVHAMITADGSLNNDTAISNTLLSMYARCGVLEKAQQVFDELAKRDVVSWNALISGYTQQKCGEEALHYFERMQLSGVSADEVTSVCIMKACGSIGAAEKAKEIHAKVAKDGLLSKNVLVGTTLVDMYAKCGELSLALEVFDALQDRNVVSWSALITGYTQHGCFEEALACFECMEHEGVSPDAVILLCIMKACGTVGTTDKAQQIHSAVLKEWLLGEKHSIGNALVDMHAKCGAIVLAQEVFDKLPVRDVICYNGLIAGYAQFGEDKIVFYLLDKMIGDGLLPNAVTIVSILNVCGNSGLVEEGQMYYDITSAQYDIMLTPEHHSCLVDVFARAGQFGKAVVLIGRLPSSDYLFLWAALLGACQKWGNMKLGRLAFEYRVNLDGKDPAAYVSVSNIYIAAGMPEDASEIEDMRMKNEAWMEHEY